MDDLARDRVRQRDVAAHIEPEPGVGPARGPRPPRIDHVQPRAAMHGLQDVVEEDRMRLTGVGAPEDQQIRLLDLLIGRRAAARAEYRRQTDDAGSVSSAVARVDVVRPQHRADELLRQIVHLVRCLRAAEHAERARRVLRPRARQAGRRDIERLIPTRGLSTPFTRTSGSVSRPRFLRIPITSPHLSGEPHEF